MEMFKIIPTVRGALQICGPLVFLNGDASRSTADELRWGKRGEREQP